MNPLRSLLKKTLTVLAPLATLVMPVAAAAQGQPEVTRITNTATLSVGTPDGVRQIPSNTVELGRTKYPTRISFRRLPTDFVPDYSKLVCETDPLRFTPLPVTAAELAKAEPLASLDLHNPLIIVLEAKGENKDPSRIERTEMLANSGSRTSRIVMVETGPDTGMFAGAFPPSTMDDNVLEAVACDITQDNDGWLTLSFAEDEDSYGSTNALLIDPLGHVFDSATGKPINGATVTLIDEATGQPATQVFGDDGMSAYPNQVVTGQDVVDAGGWRYTLDDGDFRFPLVAKGRYRLVVTPPAGYTAPSKRKPEEMTGLRNPHGLPYQISAASYGTPFDLVDPEPMTIDIPIDTAAGGVDPNASPRLVVEKIASSREAEIGDFVQYRVSVSNKGTLAAKPVVVTDTLPRGLHYRVGSTRGATEPVVSGDGKTLRFTLPSLAVDARIEFTYLVEIPAGAPTGEAINRVVATAPGQGGEVSGAASAPVRIRPPLFTDSFTVIGRVTEGGCMDPERGRKGVAGIRLMIEDGSFVVTDKDGYYHFEGVAPGTHVVQLDRASVPRTHAPLICDRDTRSAGNGISRFVEGSGGSLQRVDFQLRPTGLTAEAKDALPITPVAPSEAAGNRDDWLDRAEPGIGWLFPEIDYNPRAPSVRAVIRHLPGQRVAMSLNGKLVDALTFDGSDADEARGVAISRWSGLAIVEGENKLEARVLNADGSVAQTLERVVHFSGLPTGATYVADKSRLSADGLTRPLIAVRVTDRAGRPVRQGTLVAFRVDQPYRAAQQVEAEQGRQLAGLEKTQATAAVIGDEGLAFIALEPTRQAGMAHLTLTLAERDREQKIEIKAWLAAPAQDWVVVGFGKGTIGYDTLAGAEKLEKGKRHDVVTDGQLALYAKGRIKGQWLLTLAYDSDRDEERMRDRGVLGAIDPNRYYTVYGDGTLQGQDAPSRRKLYIRLERPEFVALFGDYETGLVETRLGRFSRTLNGVRAEYIGRALHFTAFAARDDSRFGRDEIQGNGLSGPYRLTARDLIPGSDKLRIEVRDRFRSELVLDSRLLTRHIDYDIDSLAGTLRFREPILSRDPELNPIFIVAEYETRGGINTLVAGGRASVKAGPAELGATVLRDESFGDAMLAAADAKVALSRTTEVRAEMGFGGRFGIEQGKAWLVEAEHHGPAADVLAYARQQDSDYGFGQQNSGEAGTRKIGFDGRLRIGQRLSLVGSAWHQDQLDGPANRIAGEVRAEYRRDAGTLYGGLRYASDRGVGTTGDDRRSLLLTLGGTQKLFANRLELNAEAQVPLGGEDASVDFPARQRLGASWRFKDWLRLVGDIEIAKGQEFTAQNARIGFDVAPWGGARLMTTINRGDIGENGPRTYAQYGLSQSLPLGKRWTIDATLDSASTISGHIPEADIVNPLHPVSSGGALGGSGLEEDFVSLTLGATYRGNRWSWNGRGEIRLAGEERRWGLTSNLLRSLGQGSTLASGVRVSHLRERSGAVSSSITADLALALRPVDSRWSLLERFQLRQDSAGAQTSTNNSLGIPTFANGTLATFRLVNNIAVNYRTGAEGDGHGFEASLYYGAKYVRGRYADETVDGFVHVVGVELRQDLGTRFDIGAQASVQHGLTSGTIAWSAGPSAGASPAKNLWVTAGYNISGYRDRDFEDARWTRQGPYLTVRMKFDQDMLGSLVRPILGGRR
ncbi:hypothetical protein TPR58_14245 [Sphingomonas sp. HF-S3]|uniref:DUF11 domain-containing protein n=1 Tax=Sphingomonas rustica TaxID=3103142 RepID=A0ABV0BD65_9SPHN